jgi:osmoprotectant transport system permease protein
MQHVRLPHNRSLAEPTARYLSNIRARVMTILVISLLALPVACSQSGDPVIIGSKAFTESVILGEIVQQTLERAGVPAVHRRELGGSRVLFDALRGGQIDAYPEYRGTLYLELLKGDPSPDQRLEQLGLTSALSFGFENTYVLGTTTQVAARSGLERISDLRGHPDLRFGFSNEFIDRADGWPGLQRRYGLPQRNVRGLDHQLAYRAMLRGDLDVTDLYSTDPEIVRYRLKVLADDLHFFPNYEALLLARSDLDPAARAALNLLRGRIDTESMARMNAAVTLDGRTESEVAREWVDSQFEAPASVQRSKHLAPLIQHTGEHLLLTGVSLAAAVIVGLPLGIIAARRPRFGRILLATTGVVQTIPSLALLVFMIPLLGIGFAPAVVALFLYSLLPIIRNTATGLLDIPQPLRESAIALGLTEGARLRLIELPLATRSVLAGIKTAAVINIGTATLGALIGAGGYGQPILTGIRLNDIGLILQGAVPAALLALLVQWLFDLIERWLLPRQRPSVPAMRSGSRSPT